jgi:translocation and assembly module TamB
LKRRTIHLLGFIEFAILLLTLLFFVLASEKSMIYLVNKVTDAYEIKYQKLEGNLLKHITLSGLTYKGSQLADKAHIDINFKSLLRAKIVIDDLALQKMDLSVLEQIIEDQHLKNKKRSSLGYVPTITVTSLFFSAKPYHGHDINVDSLKFIANDIRGDLTDLVIGSFSFYTESDHTNITANGSMNDKILDFDHLWITDIDIEKIIQFYKDKIKSNSSDTGTKKKKGFKNLVKEFKIDNFKTDIKPYSYKKYKIKKLEIKAYDFSTDLAKFYAKTSITAKTNMWELNSQGHLKDKKFFTNAKVTLIDKYFKKFVPFFDHNKIKPIELSLELDQNGLNSDIKLKSDNLLTGKLKDLNLSVKSAKAHAKLDFKPINLEVKIDGELSSKHSKTISLKSNLHYDKKRKFRYDGILFSKKLRNLESSLTELMKDSKLTFYGDTKKIQAKLTNKNLWADYNSTHYKSGLLNINLKKISLNHYISNLPSQLSNIEFTGMTKIPIDFKNLGKFNSDLYIKSNLVNLKGKLKYEKGFILNAAAKLPQNSILENFDKKLKTKALFPIDIKATLQNSIFETSFIHGELDGNFLYNAKKKMIDAKLNLAEEKFALKGNINNQLFLKASTNSLKTFQEKALKYYDFKKQPIDGEVVINGIIYSSNNMDLNIKSRWLVYEYKPNKFAFAEKIKLDINKKQDHYLLQNYYLSTYLDYDRIFFAKKPSLFSFKNSQIDIRNLWINDQATIIGGYNIKNESGKFSLNAKSYHYKGKEGNIYADLSLRASLGSNFINIDGNIDVLNGVVTYKAKKEHYIQDDDIIIIQEQLTKEAKRKKNNITLDISLLSKKPIRYKTDDTNILLDFDLKFWKEKNSEVELLGIAKLLEGTHMEAKKEFKVQNGEILFAGEIFNPFLNINVFHQSDPYEIMININGLLDSPIINFSSTPFLTQSDILSILLFDSTTEDLFNSEGDSSKAAISMFGNTFAKELVENFGIKLDKLVLSTTEEGGFGLEVGKKISRKVTILYINDIVQTIKVKYQHSRRFETDITISPDTSGIDFLYKNEY